MVNTQQMLEQEVEKAGGERALNHLSQDQRAIWNKQAIVLATVREDGDPIAGAYIAGATIDEAADWEENDVLNYTARSKHALQEHGYAIKRKILARIEDGKISSPTVLMGLLAAYLPEEFDKDARKNKRAMNPLDSVRKQNEDYEAKVNAEVERRQAIWIEQMESRAEPELDEDGNEPDFMARMRELQAWKPEPDAT